MNTVILTGRLTRDPQLNRSKSETAYCRFNLAVDRGKNKNGEKETDFPTIVCFGKTAENLARFTEQGNLIAVQGEVRTGKYEKEGKTFYTEEIFANRIEFLQWKKKDGESDSDDAPEAIEEDTDSSVERPAAATDGGAVNSENKSDNASEGQTIFTDDNLPF